MLEDRRRELVNTMHGRIRDVRTRDVAREPAASADGFDADSQADIDLALIEMKADMLLRVDAALRRLDEGRYGNCIECQGPIARERLRALPFAVRCRHCEDARESAIPRGGRPTAPHGVFGALTSYRTD